MAASLSAAAASPSDLRHRLKAVALLVEPHAAWAAESDAWPQQLARLLGALEELAAAQPRFALVDGARPFAWRAERMLAWLATDPDFRTCGEGGRGLELVDDLPAERGSRGVRLRAGGGGVAAGAEALRVPMAAVLSTETALESRELGPLLEQPALRHLVGVPTVFLGLHLLIEHAKSLEAEAAAAAAASASGTGGAGGDDPAAEPPPGDAARLGGRSEAEIAADRARALSDLEAANRAASGGGGAGAIGRGGPGPGAGPALRPTRLDLASHPWGSRFRAFIACLPPSAAAIGNCLSWGAADFRLLGSSRLAFAAARFVRDIAKGYTSLFGAFAEAGAVRGLERHFTWAHWRWAVACVMSRQNQLPGRRGGHHLVLAPLYDMVNHAPGPITSFFEAGAVELRAARGFAEGEELTMSYGARPDDQLLMFQGFCAPLAERAGGAHGGTDATEAAEAGPEAAAATAEVLVAAGPPSPDPLEKLRASIASNLRGGAKGVAAGAAGAVGATTSGLRPAHFVVSRSRAGAVALPAALLSHCRVAALDRDDAPAALRAVQALLVAARTRDSAAAAATEAGGEGHGHSHGHGDACGCAPPGPLLLPFLSERNEARAKELAAVALRAAAEAAEGAESAGAAEHPAIRSFVLRQARMLRDALAALERGEAWA